jgi:hypothetical protein
VTTIAARLRGQAVGRALVAGRWTPQTGGRFLLPELSRYEGAAAWLYQLLTWELELQGNRHHQRHRPKNRRKSEAGSGASALAADPIAA